MTDVFYSTKVKSKVSIPSQKVCGYRIKNYNTRRGWQSGLRAGRDNGVVNQKFSRFATDDCSANHSGCAGNTNWMNPKEHFNKPESISFFDSTNIRPNRFYAGEIATNTHAPDLKKNNRAGRGNKLLERHNFKAAPIQGRDINRFQALQVLALNESKTVELGAATLGKLLEVKEPDPLDTKWTSEKARLKAILIAKGLSDVEAETELKSNKPLGREQRTVTKTKSLGQANLSIDKKLDELKQEVDDGKAENLTGRATLLARLTLILSKAQGVETLSANNRFKINQLLAKSGIGTLRPFDLGIPDIVDWEWVNANNGNNRAILELFLLSKVGTTSRITQQQPVLDNNKSSSNNANLNALSTMYAKMRLNTDQRMFLVVPQNKFYSIISMRAILRNPNNAIRKDSVALSNEPSLRLIDSKDPRFAFKP